MTEAVPGYLRIRVVNPRVSTIWSENFENTPNPNSITLWHSLGTEAGTDNSINYWTIDAGSPTYSNHVLTVPNNAALIAGHPDWGDMRWDCRFNWVTNAGPAFYLHYVNSSNFVLAQFTSGTTLTLYKMVAGVQTQVAQATNVSLTTGNNYWVRFTAQGSSYNVSCAADSSGAQGTQIGSTVSGTISDSAVTTGPIRFFAGGTAGTNLGGAFNNVCIVTNNNAYTSPNFWTPVVTTGEPAFALSTISPQSGAYSASIYVRGSSAGNGSWQQSTTLAATQATTQSLLQGQIKASAGTANISAGGLTTTNATTSFANQTATGTMTANPTVSCNYSGAVGSAYFDSLSIVSQGTEITSDLPHLHQATYQVVAMQPGNPGSSALGSFTVRLFPPGSEGFAAAKAIYDQLDYTQRLEFYLGHTLGKMDYAGIVTGIRKDYGDSGNVFELTGVSDLFWANYSKPFPAEFLDLTYGTSSKTAASYRQARSYFGTNEGFTDSFSPYVASNYTSTNLPSLTAGTWTATTDAGVNVVSCSTGTGAVLVSKAGATTNDARSVAYVEVSGRLKPSSDTTNAGSVGVGLTSNNSGFSTGAGVMVYITAKANTSRTPTRWDLDVKVFLINGVVITQSSALTSVDDPEGFIPFTIGLFNPVTDGVDSSAIGDIQVIVNGKQIGDVFTWATGYSSTASVYPFVLFETPATGSATAYISNLTALVRYSDDKNAGSAVFASGTIGTPAHSLGLLSTPPPTFLDVWTQAATVEGWYWRYTPSPYVVGNRKLGTVDMTTDPGTDRSTQCIFNRDAGNLVQLQLSANAEQIAAGTSLSGTSGTDGGGVAVFRDASTMLKYGVIEDQVLSVTDPTYPTQFKAVRQVINNKINLGTAGSKTAKLLRDPYTADVWRELDKITIHDPKLGVNYLSARVIAYEFTEGAASQQVTLDQFSTEDITLPVKRFQTGVFQVASKFGNR